MKTEDLILMAQLVESLDLTVRKLENALEKKDIEEIKKLKAEVLNLQKEMAKIIG